jgi:hypothetical protein
MNIKFINHSSILLDSGNHKILCDPWYKGSIFNDGWKLIHESNQSINDFDLDFIWYSHEHPDHFSVLDINKINEDKKKKIKILFQETLDRKVVKFLTNKNFKVEELKLESEKKINNELSIVVGSVGGFDSWILFKTKDYNILNLNDCQTSEKNLKNILKIANNKIDVLMTQFSFANWICNNGDHELARKQIQLVRSKVKRQVEILKPKYLIPFASFTYFCNIENFYLNQYSIEVEEFYQEYKDICKVIVMFPGDKFQPSENYDSRKSLNKWRVAYDKIKQTEPIVSKTIEFQKIVDAHEQYIQNIKKNNNFLLIYILTKINFFSKQRVFINDLGITVEFDLISKLKKSNREDKSIILNSDSLFYLFMFQWGRGTLFINGRVKCAYKNLNEFLKLTKISYSNNIGLSFPKSLKFSELAKKSSFTELLDETIE